MGVAWSFIHDNYTGGKPEWTGANVPDLTGIVTIVTGGNTGIGKETAKVLAFYDILLQHNAKVYIATRNKEKAEKAIKDLKEETGHEALFLELDLASLKSIKSAAEEFQRKETQLHILFNNGGVMYPPIDMLTSDGFDLQFGVNVLGHFYFTKLLLPTLISTAQTTASKQVRVINVSSWGHNLGGLDFNTFKDSPVRKKKGTHYLYHQSKFANIVFSNELAKRYAEQGIVSISLHPGTIRSELTRHMNVSSVVRAILEPIVYYPVERGALTQLRAGIAPEAAEWNGKYLIPWGRLWTPKKGTDDAAVAKQLWEYMEEQVKDV